MIINSIPGEILSLKRDRKDTRLGFSDNLSVPIFLDTGADIAILSQECLDEIQKKGGIREIVSDEFSLTYSDCSSDSFESRSLLSFFPSSQVYIESMPAIIGYRIDNSLLLGLDFLSGKVIEYTPESIRVLKNCPSEYSMKLPLIKNEKMNRYFLKLSVNGHENLYYLDTGHFDDFSLPLSDKEYAQGPIKVVKDTLYVGSHSREITDYLEKATVRIGDMELKGRVVYNDYYARYQYWFNPCSVFERFAIDLKNEVLAICLT